MGYYGKYMSSVDKNTDVVNSSTLRKHDKRFVVRTYAMDVAAAKQKAAGKPATNNTQPTQNPPSTIPIPPRPLKEKKLSKIDLTKTSGDTTPIQVSLTTHGIIPQKISITQNTTSIHTPATHISTVSAPNVSDTQVVQPIDKEKYIGIALSKPNTEKEAPEIPTNLVITHHNQDIYSESFFSRMLAWLMGSNGEIIPAKTKNHENIVVQNGDTPKVPTQSPSIKVQEKKPLQDVSHVYNEMPAPSTQPEISVVPPGIFQKTKILNPNISQEIPNSQIQKENTSKIPNVITSQVPIPPTATVHPVIQSITQQIKTSDIQKTTSNVPEKILTRNEPRLNIHKRLRNKILSPLHTYKMDVTDTIKETNASATSILAGQQDAQPISDAPKKNEKRTLLWFVIGGALLFILSIVGTGYAYQYHIKKVAPARTAIHVPSLVPTNATRELSGTGIALLDELAKVAQTPIQNGAIKTVYIATSTKDSNGTLEKRPLPGGYLIAAMSLPMPRILMNNTAVDSTVGVVGADNQTYPFFILRVASYDSAFAGMLRWESSLASDMQMLYPPPITKLPAVNTSTTTATSTEKSNTSNNSTSTTTTKQIVPIPAGFVDETIVNHNVRVLKNASGQSILLYGFANKHTLIIARNADAFTVILGKLNQQ